MTRRLAHEPLGWRATTLVVTVRRYRCTGCAHVWRQDTTRAARLRARLSRRALRWALEGIVCQHLSVARVAEGLGVAWNTANDAVLAEGKRVLIDDEHRFDGVKVVGVDEHVWRHTPKSLSTELCVGWFSEVGVDAVGVGDCELGEGLLPVGGGASFHHGGWHWSAEVARLPHLLLPGPGSLVLDVHDAQP